jgi:hypothetical protein
MARVLTADEQLRYPWATRIGDYVPVGRARKLALLAVGVGVAVLILGLGFLYVTADDVRHGVAVRGPVIGWLTLIIPGVLFAIAFVIGCVTAVPALIHKATTPLVWSLCAIAPLVIGVVVLSLIGG